MSGSGSGSKEEEIETVVWNAQILNNALVGGLVLCLPSLLFKFAGGSEFQVLDVSFDVEHAWLLALFVTVAHSYCGMMFRYSLGAFFATNPDEATCKKLYLRVTGREGLIFRGLIGRFLNEKGQRALMLPNDPTTWVYFSLFFYTILVCIPFREVSWFGYVIYSVIGLYLALWNWTTGSRWVLALSLLQCREAALEEYLTERFTARPPLKKSPSSYGDSAMGNFGRGPDAGCMMAVRLVWLMIFFGAGGVGIGALYFAYRYFGW